MSKKENQNNKNYNIEKGEVLVGSSLLRKKNIGCSIYYPYTVPLMNYYKKKYKIKKKKFINSSKISNCSIALPVGPHLNKEDMKIISQNLIDQLSIFNKV